MNVILYKYKINFYNVYACLKINISIDKFNKIIQELYKNDYNINQDG